MVGVHADGLRREKEKLADDLTARDKELKDALEELAKTKRAVRRTGTELFSGEEDDFGAIHGAHSQVPGSKGEDGHGHPRPKKARAMSEEQRAYIGGP